MRSSARIVGIGVLIALAVILIAYSQHADREYATREAPVFRAEQTDETITLRTYGDNEAVAYVSVADFYGLMLPQGTADATEQADDLLRELESIDLASYGIAMHTDETGVWLPIQTLSILFSNTHSGYASYNGKTVYVNDDTLMSPMEERDQKCAQRFFTSKVRSEDQIAFDYAQLRLVLASFYGRLAQAGQPAGQESAGQGAGTDKDAFEAHLDGLGEVGEAIREGLKSKSVAEYLLAGEALSWSVANANTDVPAGFVRYAKLGSTRVTGKINKQYESLLHDSNNLLGTYVCDAVERCTAKAAGFDAADGSDVRTYVTGEGVRFPLHNT